VEFFAGSDKIGDAASPPYTMTWTNPPPGKYAMTARATDNAGGMGTSVPGTLFVAGTGGVLSGSRATNTLTSLNLTAEGTSDWAHWGMLNASNFNHKASGGMQISNVVRIGTHPINRLTDNRTTFAWSDGTPVSAVSGTNAALFINGVTNGFRFTVAADRNIRTLRVYAGLYAAQGNFQAWLSDFSGQAYTDVSFRNASGNSYAVYTVTYAASSPNQRLIVRYTVENLYDFDFGNVTLQAATLQGSIAPPLPVELQTPTLTPDGFAFSFFTESGRTYAVQMAPWLPATNWATFTNVPGMDGPLRITNFGAPPAQGFYRVLPQ
jgi:hypothetical protein